MPRQATSDRAATPATPEAVRARMDEMVIGAAARFVADDRMEATMRHWLARATRPPDEYGEIAMAADALLLATDLTVSQPSASGATALDRLARAEPAATEIDAAAMAGLSRSRYRLVVVQEPARARILVARDLIGRETLRLLATALPPLEAGLALFGRLCPLADGSFGFAGAVTPLDDAAVALARRHICAGARGAAAAARWAEAIYGHVVRCGTLDIPGLNRPREGIDDGLEDPQAAALHALVEDWAALAEGAAPGPELLQRTRQMADRETIVAGLVLAALRTEMPALAAPLERLLLVQLETVRHRERSGSGGLTLAAIAAELDRLIAGQGVPAGARAAFDALRLRLSGGSGRAEDRELERLVQRIQGLRAKTVAQGCTEQEALAAAEKVAELLDRYGLTLGELELREQPCEGIGVQTDRRRFAPIDGCVPTIAAFFDCRVWVEQKAKGAALRYVFFGLRGDVAAAQYLYELVDRAFETETAAFRGGDLYAEMPSGARRTATTSFRTGLAHGIRDKLAALRAAREAMLRSGSGRDLVPLKAAVVEEEMAKLGLDLHKRETARRKRVLTDAFAAGQAAGQRFDYTPGITQAT